MQAKRVPFSLCRVAVCVLLAVLLALPAMAFAADKPLSGRTISVMGDSISTYVGWSDARPITDEGCAYRYGEAYYGPEGADCHNTTLKVEDTWWHQAAQQLGAEILMSNAGNSSGLLYASYPANADWENYLQDMLAYKTRPNHMGFDGKDPDIIALYIGSNEVGKCRVQDFGTVEDVDFDTLITRSGNGYAYAQPATVAEAYCILLHKLSVNYPQAEIYCFAVVPHAGGTLSTVNKRLAPCYPFNEMVRGVASHYGAHVVELLEAFELDPDGDGVAVQSDVTRFQACYHNDPHPNAAGFDVITRAFVDAVMENSRYIVEVETRAGQMENVQTQVTASGPAEDTTITRTAVNVRTPKGMTVQYSSTAHLVHGEEESFSESYTSQSSDQTYRAQGGRTRSLQKAAPQLALQIPLNADEKDSAASKTGTAPVITGDYKADANDGVYDYTVISLKKRGSAAVHTGAATVTEKANAYTDMKGIVSNTFGTETNDLEIVNERVKRPTGPADAPKVADGYDYAYIGSDQLSRYYAAFAYTQPQPSRPNEEPAYEGNGLKTYVDSSHATLLSKRYNLIIPRLYLKSGTVEEQTIARWASLQQYTLADRSGNVLTTYCADQLTNTIDNYSYKLHNLDDASYYTPADAERIRTILFNAYWGLEEGPGSLTAVKDMMRRSGQFTQAEIDLLNEGMAMTATQYAIWFSSNRAKNTIYLHSYYTGPSGFEYPAQAAGKEAADLIFKLCFFLTDLEPEAEPEKDTAHAIINDQNFLDQVGVVLKGKPHTAANLDTDPANDVYTADLTVQLAVKPLENNEDDLVMKILGKGNRLIAAGRIAGALREGEMQPTNDGHGAYTFHDITLTEDMESISFALQGKQNLQRDAYLFLSEVNDGKESQPMVSVLSGVHNVDVELTLEIEMDIEDDEMIIEHVWRAEEMFPALPVTGDDSRPLLWAQLCVLSLTGAWLALKRRSRLSR